MPTIITHAVVGAGAGAILTRFRGLPPLFWVLCAGLSMLPDIDVVAFWLRIPFTSVWGHRGLSHSLAAAAATSAIAAAIVRRRIPLSPWRLGACFFVAMASHGLLDALTNGGPGVAFFAPFDTTRYFFPVRPVLVSPIGLGFFSRRGLRVIESELLWIWLPLAGLVIAGAAPLYRAGESPHRPPPSQEGNGGDDG
jgi:inner membrane protein